MLTFLFWNIQKKPILHRVARLCAGHAVDVLILAECAEPVDEVTQGLEANGAGGYSYPLAFSDRLRVYTRIDPARVRPVFDDANARLTVRKIVTPGPRPSLLLCAVHLPSAIAGWQGENRAPFAQIVAGMIHEQEDRQRTRRTVVVGDFNMNPFDAGMVNGFGFHAHLTRELASRRGGRVVQEQSTHRTFFNPMWQFLADRPGKPSGSYYFHESVPVNHYWHVLDQVLVRPELCDKLIGVDIRLSSR